MGQDQSKGMTVQSFTNSIAWDDDSKRLEAMNNLLAGLEKEGDPLIMEFIYGKKAMDVLFQYLEHPSKIYKNSAFQILIILSQNEKFLDTFVLNRKSLKIINLNNHDSLSHLTKVGQIVHRLAKNPLRLGLLFNAGILSDLILLGMDCTYHVKIGKKEYIPILTLVAHSLAIFSETENQQLLARIGDSNIMPLIVNILRESTNEKTLAHTMKAISNLCCFRTIRSNFIMETGIIYLVKHFSPKNHSINLFVALALASLAKGATRKEHVKIRSSGCIEQLINLTKDNRSSSDVFKLYGALALLEMCGDQMNQHYLYKDGGIHLILQIQHFLKKCKNKERDFLRITQTLMDFSMNTSHLIIIRDIIICITELALNLLKSPSLEIRTMAIKSLSYYALLKTGRRVIYNSSQQFFYNIIKEIEDLFDREEEDNPFIISALNTLGNLMISNKIRKELPYQVKEELMDTFLKCQGQDEMAMIAKLGLSIMQTKGMNIDVQENFKIRSLMRAIKCADVQIQCKALKGLEIESKKKRLDKCFQMNCIKAVIKLLNDPPSWVLREIANLLGTVCQNPMGILVWYKFGSSRIMMDSANSVKSLVWGTPERLPKDKGLYENWGALFSFGDLIEIPKMIELPSEYSISFWFIMPLIPSNSWHTLIQNYKGLGGSIVADPKCTFIGAFDENTGEFLHGIKLKGRLKYGWHNCVLNYSNGVGTFFIDGKKTREARICLEANIRYIGNSSTGEEPFGVIADLRIYPYKLKPGKPLHRVSAYAPLFRDLMPDYYYGLLLKNNFIMKFVDGIKCRIPDTIIKIIRLLANISTNHDCKMYLIKNNILNSVIKYFNHTNDKLRKELYRLLVNLAQPSIFLYLHIVQFNYCSLL